MDTENILNMTEEDIDMMQELRNNNQDTFAKSIKNVKGGRGEENQPPRLKAASAFASVFEPGHTCLLYIYICIYIYIYIHIY